MSSSDSESESGKGEEEEEEEEQEPQKSSEEGEEEAEEEEEEEEEEAEEEEEEEENEEENEEEEEEEEENEAGDAEEEDENEGENGRTAQVDEPAPRSSKRRRKSTSSYGAEANGNGTRSRSKPVTKGDSLTTLAFPIGRVRRLVKSEVDVHNVGADAGFLVALATDFRSEFGGQHTLDARHFVFKTMSFHLLVMPPERCFSALGVVASPINRNDLFVAVRHQEPFLEKFVEDAFDKMTEDERTVLSYNDLAVH